MAGQGQYNFKQSDLEVIKSVIAERLKLKEGEILCDGKKIKITMKGEPGKTPVKGVDYRDGADGEPGVEPEEMAVIRIDLALMKDAIKKMKQDIKTMEERVSNIKDGDDGYTPKKGVDYNDGEPGRTPVKGVDYKDGEPGRTPVKGVDYVDGSPGKPPEHQWDGTKLRFRNPDGNWGQWSDLQGKKGDPGYTPKKGVDYNDGDDGVTPVKGVDYHDGKDAKIPQSTTITVLSDVEHPDLELMKKFKQVKVYIED